MTDAISIEIEAAQEKLRAIDGNLAALGGRPGNTLKRRLSDESTFYSRRSVNGPPPDARGGVRRRIEMDGVSSKRSREDEDDDMDAGPKRTLQSTVVMPTIETKSREEAITEMKGGEKKEITQRNRRMFSNLLVGTLQRFQKDERKVAALEKQQEEKRAEVERRLEDAKREEREKIVKEKAELFSKRKEEEQALRGLQRKKALMQYAEQKQNHYRKLQNFIQTKTKPTLFFLPVKHTLQTLELLKNSSQALQDLIDLRQAELEKELAGDTNRDEERGLRSYVATKGEEEEEDEEEVENKDEAGTVRVEMEDSDHDSEPSNDGEQ